MKFWLALTRLIDALNERVGRAAYWLVLLTVLISGVNAVMRYGFGLSSNAWLELQWYLFGAMFLLAAGYTLKHNGHVRIDVLHGRLSKRAQAWIDILGGLVILLPLCILMAWLAWHGLADSFQHSEMSPDSGGLLRWPVRALIPLGFLLLGLQAVSETIKRIAYLRGAIELPEERPREDV